jgi:hypothetical protein
LAAAIAAAAVLGAVLLGALVYASLISDRRHRIVTARGLTFDKLAEAAGCSKIGSVPSESSNVHPRCLRHKRH